ncbi:MAG: hypothetical protein ACFBWO_00510 [Paracoccaceae bacterium]
MPDAVHQRAARRTYVLVLAVLFALAALATGAFSALPFTDDLTRAVTDRFLAIGLVALFLERAIDVYVVGWRRLGEQEAVDRLGEAEARGSDTMEVRQLRFALSRYRAETQRAAFIVALVVGVVVAATGMRVLDGLIDLDPVAPGEAPLVTRAWWTLDILLSGGVIGGGAAGIHQILGRLGGGTAASAFEGVARRRATG